MDVVRGHVTEAGRISLPARMRRELGLQNGGGVLLRLQNGEIRITTVAQGVARAQQLSGEMLGDRPESSVDEFLAWRKRDSGE